MLAVGFFALHVIIWYVVAYEVGGRAALPRFERRSWVLLVASVVSLLCGICLLLFLVFPGIDATEAWRTSVEATCSPAVAVWQPVLDVRSAVLDEIQFTAISLLGLGYLFLLGTLLFSTPDIPLRSRRAHSDVPVSH